MSPAERYNLTDGIKGSYNPFEYSIHCQSRDDYATYLHEYAHHIQNVTTIQGAERLQAFLQLAAHLSKLGQLGEPVQVPLVEPIHRQRPADASDRLQERWKDIDGHWREILYWDQLYPYTGLQRPEEVQKLSAVHGDLPLFLYETDYHGDGGLTYIPIYIRILDDDRIKGYPIGGRAIGEGISRSLELLAQGEHPELPNEPITNANFVYHVWPSIMQTLFGREVGLHAAVLLGDLALSFSSPHVATAQILLECALWKKESDGTDIDVPTLRRLYFDFAERFRDHADIAVQLELESLQDIKERAADQYDVFREAIDWQIENLVRAFEKRQQAPDYFATALLKATTQPKWLSHLTADYPPLRVVFEDDESGGSHTDEASLNRLLLLQKLYDLFEFLYYDVDATAADLGLSKKQLELDVEKLSPTTFQLKQREIAPGETNHEGKLLEILKIQETVFRVG